MIFGLLNLNLDHHFQIQIYRLGSMRNRLPGGLNLGFEADPGRERGSLG